MQHTLRILFLAIYSIFLFGCENKLEIDTSFDQEVSVYITKVGQELTDQFGDLNKEIFSSTTQFKDFLPIEGECDASNGTQLVADIKHNSGFVSKEQSNIICFDLSFQGNLAISDLSDGNYEVEISSGSGFTTLRTARFSFVRDVTKPIAPIVIVFDTGVDTNDGITSINTFAIDGVEENEEWFYSFDGKNWLKGVTKSIKVDGDATKAVAYSVHTRQIDSYGNESAIGKKSFLLDISVPPEPLFSLLEDTGMYDDDLVTNSDWVKIAGHEKESYMQYAINNLVFYYGKVSNIQAKQGKVKDGKIRFFGNQIDLAGNASSWVSFDFILDTIAPNTLSASLAKDNGHSAFDLVTNHNIINISNIHVGPFNSTDTTIDTYTIVFENIQTNEEQIKIFSATQSNADVSIDIDGTYNISFYQTDRAGNNSDSFLISQVTYDSKKPDTPNIILLEDTGLYDNDNISNNSVIELSNVEKNSKYYLEIQKINKNSDIDYSWDVVAIADENNFNIYDISQDGKYKMFVYLEDIAGNISDTFSYDFTYDSIVPPVPQVNLLEDTYPICKDGNRCSSLLDATTENDRITSNANIIIDIEDNQVQGVIDFDIKLTDSNDIVQKKNDRINVNTHHITYDVENLFGKNESDGVYDVTYNHLDLAGNKSSPTTISLYLDTTISSIDISLYEDTGVAYYDLQNNQKNDLFYDNYTNNAIFVVSQLIYGILQTFENTIDYKGALFFYTITDKKGSRDIKQTDDILLIDNQNHTIDFTSLSDSSYRIYVRYYDVAGNNTDVAMDVTIDTEVDSPSDISLVIDSGIESVDHASRFDNKSNHRRVRTKMNNNDIVALHTYFINNYTKIQKGDKTIDIDESMDNLTQVDFTVDISADVPYTILTNAIDRAGNISESKNIDITYDNAVDTIVITHDDTFQANNNGVSQNGFLHHGVFAFSELEFFTVDTSGYFDYTIDYIKINGEDKKEKSVKKVFIKNEEMKVDILSVFDSTNDNITATLTTQQTDFAGNVSVASNIDVTIDRYAENSSWEIIDTGVSDNDNITKNPNVALHINMPIDFLKKIQLSIRNGIDIDNIASIVNISKDFIRDCFPDGNRVSASIYTSCKNINDADTIFDHDGSKLLSYYVINKNVQTTKDTKIEFNLEKEDQINNIPYLLTATSTSSTDVVSNSICKSIIYDNTTDIQSDKVIFIDENSNDINLSISNSTLMRLEGVEYDQYFTTQTCNDKSNEPIITGEKIELTFTDNVYGEIDQIIEVYPTNIDVTVDIQKFLTKGSAYGSLSILQTDKAGNSITKTFDISVDTKEPFITSATLDVTNDCPQSNETIDVSCFAKNQTVVLDVTFNEDVKFTNINKENYGIKIDIDNEHNETTVQTVAKLIDFTEDNDGWGNQALFSFYTGDDIYQDSDGFVLVGLDILSGSRIIDKANNDIIMEEIINIPAYIDSISPDVTMDIRLLVDSGIGDTNHASRKDRITNDLRIIIDTTNDNDVLGLHRYIRTTHTSDISFDVETHFFSNIEQINFVADITLQNIDHTMYAYTFDKVRNQSITNTYDLIYDKNVDIVAITHDTTHKANNNGISQNGFLHHGVFTFSNLEYNTDNTSGYFDYTIDSVTINGKNSESKSIKNIFIKNKDMTVDIFSKFDENEDNITATLITQQIDFAGNQSFISDIDITIDRYAELPDFVFIDTGVSDTDGITNNTDFTVDLQMPIDFVSQAVMTITSGLQSDKTEYRYIFPKAFFTQKDCDPERTKLNITQMQTCIDNAGMDVSTKYSTFLRNNLFDIIASNATTALVFRIDDIDQSVDHTIDVFFSTRNATNITSNTNNISMTLDKTTNITGEIYFIDKNNNRINNEISDSSKIRIEGLEYDQYIVGNNKRIVTGDTISYKIGAKGEVEEISITNENMVIDIKNLLQNGSAYDILYLTQTDKAGNSIDRTIDISVDILPPNIDSVVLQMTNNCPENSNITVSCFSANKDVTIDVYFNEPINFIDDTNTDSFVAQLHIHNGSHAVTVDAQLVRFPNNYTNIASFVFNTGNGLYQDTDLKIEFIGINLLENAKIVDKAMNYLSSKNEFDISVYIDSIAPPAVKSISFDTTATISTATDTLDVGVLFDHFDETSDVAGYIFSFFSEEMAESINNITPNFISDISADFSLTTSIFSTQCKKIRATVQTIDAIGNVSNAISTSDNDYVYFSNEVPDISAFVSASGTNPLTFSGIDSYPTLNFSGFTLSDTRQCNLDTISLGIQVFYTKNGQKNIVFPINYQASDNSTHFESTVDYVDFITNSSDNTPPIALQEFVTTFSLVTNNEITTDASFEWTSYTDNLPVHFSAEKSSYFSLNNNIIERWYNIGNGFYRNSSQNDTDISPDIFNLKPITGTTTKGYANIAPEYDSSDSSVFFTASNSQRSNLYFQTASDIFLDNTQNGYTLYAVITPPGYGVSKGKNIANVFNPETSADSWMPLFFLSQDTEYGENIETTNTDFSSLLMHNFNKFNWTIDRYRNAFISYRSASTSVSTGTRIILVYIYERDGIDYNNEVYVGEYLDHSFDSIKIGDTSKGINNMFIGALPYNSNNKLSGIMGLNANNLRIYELLLYTDTHTNNQRKTIQNALENNWDVPTQRIKANDSSSAGMLIDVADIYNQRPQQQNYEFDELSNLQCVHSGSIGVNAIDFPTITINEIQNTSRYYHVLAQQNLAGEKVGPIRYFLMRDIYLNGKVTEGNNFDIIGSNVSENTEEFTYSFLSNSNNISLTENTDYYINTDWLGFCEDVYNEYLYAIYESSTKINDSNAYSIEEFENTHRDKIVHKSFQKVETFHYITSPEDAVAIYAMRKLIARYDGPALGVARINAEGGIDETTDISFTQNGDLDGQAIRDFAFNSTSVASRVIVSLWYDQSGNNRHLATQNINNTSNTILAPVIFDASTDSMVELSFNNSIYPAIHLIDNSNDVLLTTEDLQDVTADNVYMYTLASVGNGNLQIGDIHSTENNIVDIGLDISTDGMTWSFFDDSITYNSTISNEGNDFSLPFLLLIKNNHNNVHVNNAALQVLRSDDSGFYDLVSDTSTQPIVNNIDNISVRAINVATSTQSPRVSAIVILKNNYGFLEERIFDYIGRSW